ncbi:SoxR reducing system RseC family protein [Shewanella woodyi]|uniref:SoxR reducing system RseC family protein n=1 Tax=Shewanella woodyi TaxID=60961 RepID=UPI0007F8C291|nr:SoxR reducing system RseC family protein [Shewanella woodyi]
MMEEMAKVLESDGKGWVTVEVQVKNACNHCDNSESCGTSAVSKAFSPKVQRFSIPSDRQYQAGELLKLGLPESVLLKAAALVYLLPLLGLFFGVAVASFITFMFNLASGDFVVIPFAIAGALLFWAKGKKMAKRMESDTQPVIISHLGHSI